MPRYSTQFPAASKILSKYEHDRAFRLHREKINNIKPGLDNKPPKRYPHLMVRMKQVQKEEERLAEVDHENKLLLQKMIYIMRTRGRVDNWNLEYEPGSLNHPYKQRQLEKIAVENLGIARRLENAQPVYKSTEFEENYQRNKYYASLREESTKDYELTPRRSKKWKSGDLEEEKNYEDDFESEDENDKEKSNTQNSSLPQINDKQKTSPRKDKNELSTQKLPQIKEKKKKSDKRGKANKRNDTSKSSDNAEDQTDNDNERGNNNTNTEEERTNDSSQQKTSEEKKDKKTTELKATQENGRHSENKEKENKNERKTEKSKKGKERTDNGQNGTEGNKSESPAEADAKQLFKVAKQLAPPEEIIIKTLVKKTHAQRMQTKAKFHQLYDLDLDTELKDGLGKDWHLVIDALLSEQGLSECEDLHKAVHSGNMIGVIEIFCSSNSSSLVKLKDSYRKEYAVSLENDISEKFKDPVQCFLLTLQKEGRDDSTTVDTKRAEKDAKSLFESGDGRWQDESGQFIMLVSKRSVAQVKATMRMYKVVSGGTDVMQVVREECDGDYADAINAFLHCAKNPQNVYAEKLYKNLDASNPAFVSTLVERSEIDIPAVRKAYKKKYDADLVDDIQDRCVHPTTKVLIELVMKVPPQEKGKGDDGKEKKYTVPPPKKQLTKRKEQRFDDSTKNNPLSQPHQKRIDPNRQKDIDKTDKDSDKKDKKKECDEGKGTVKADKNFDANDDVVKLHTAMKGLGTDEAVIMEVITSKNNEQRQQLRKKYKEKYKKDLLGELKSELTGDYEEIILALMMTPVEYNAYCLHDAVDGLGTNETALIEILSTRSSQDMKAIKEEYKKAYKSDLDEDLKGDTSKGFKEMLLQLSNSTRDTGSQVNAKDAEDDAKKLCKESGKTAKLNVEIFKDILLKKNPAQIRKTFEEFKKISKHDIFKCIKEAMSGDTEDGYIGLVKALEDHIQFFAEGLKDSFAGMGTNEKRVIRIIVSRSEIDLEEIKAKYKELYGKNLSDAVKDEFSGDLRKTLLTLIGDNDDDIRNRGNSSTDKMVFGNGRCSQTTQRSRMRTKTGSRQNGIESNTTSGRTLTNQIKLRKKQSSSMLKRRNSIADSTMTNAENKNTVDLKHSKRKTMNINRTKRIYLNPMKTSQRFVGKRRKRLNHAVTKTSDGTCCKEVQTEELDIEEDEDVDNALATIHAAKTFNPDELCAILHEAIDGFGSEKRTIIRILTSCNNRQRQQLKRVYKKMYKLDLTEELRNELSKIVETGILGLMMEPVEFSVKCLYSSMYGMCPDERLLTYVIVSCSRKEMKSLRKKYKEVFRRDLVNDVKLETNGPHQNVLLSAIEQSDLVGIIDDTNLQVAFKYDVDQPAEIFTEESRHKVRKICVKFSEMSSEDVMKSISHYSEMDSELALLALNNYTVSKLRDPISYIKSCLLEEVDVTTANDILLTYIFTSRAEIDLKDIMKRFKKKYKISLAKAVKKKYSGVLKQLLLATLNPQSFRIK